MTYSVYVTTVTNNVHCVRSHVGYEEASLEFQHCRYAIENSRPVFIKDPDDDSQICVNGNHIVEIILENEETTQVQIRKAMDSMEKEGIL